MSLSAINLKRGVTAALEDYRNTPEQFVADYVAPVVPVDLRDGYMPKFNRANQKIQDFTVGLNSPAHLVKIGSSSTAYSCVDHSAMAYLSKREFKSDTTGLMTAANKAILVDEAMRLQRENDVSTALLAMSHTTPGTLWSATGANPQQDIADQQETIDTSINRIASYGLGNFAVVTALRLLCGKAYGRSTSDLPSLADTAAWLGLVELRIARTGYDSAKPGKASVGAKLFGSKNFWIFHRPTSMSSSMPAFMATPRYTALSQPRVYNTEQPEGWGIEVNDCFQVKTIDATAGHYFSGVIA